MGSIELVIRPRARRASGSCRRWSLARPVIDVRIGAVRQRRTAMLERSTDKEKGWVLTVAGLGSFMVALDSLGLNTALATLRSDFAAPMHLLQWTVNAYNLSFAVLLMAGAALGDRFGRRRLFVAGLVLFMLASLGCALSTGILSLIMARAL